MIRLTGLIGIIGIVGLAYAFSTDRRAIRLRTILWGLGLQIVFA
ncbi:MAG: NupC/NupG family nucleoside CNT transporter, partial [Acidobacteria bacterium]